MKEPGLVRIEARRRSGQVFRARRTRLALTQAALAAGAECLPSQVGLIERGRAGVGAAVVGRVDAALAAFEADAAACKARYSATTLSAASV